MDKFYREQKNLTAAKIEFYQNYIEVYLIKLLMGFKKCFIADLFCGAGKNGNKPGSPLILIDRVKYILTVPQLKNGANVYILFNDKNEDNIENLEVELKKIEVNENINIFPIQRKGFRDILPSILKKLKNKITPKFFFLDPFTYSDVKMKDLHEIMSLKNTEILLFVPANHAYRFASDEKLKKDHKTRIFLEEFTTKRDSGYKDIDDFIQSIKERIKHELNLDFVRPILLEGGKCKNALFLLTKNQEGMMLMNQIALNKSEDGKGFNVKNYKQRTLFGTSGTFKFELFSSKLKNKMRTKGEITNLEIIKFTISEEFLPKHAKIVLIDMIKNKELQVFNQSGKKITKNKKFSIAVKPKDITIFKYISNNENK